MCRKIQENVDKRTEWLRRYNQYGPTKKLNYIDLTKEYLINELNILDIQKDDNHLSGWKIIRKDQTFVRIFLFVTQRFKNGAVRQAWYTTFKEASTHKQKNLSLASILYTWFIGTVPAGMVVDHIDNNNMNESLDNYQLLTRGQNVKKDKCGHNQYTQKEELVYKV